METVITILVIGAIGLFAYMGTRRVLAEDSGAKGRGKKRGRR